MGQEMGEVGGSGGIRLNVVSMGVAFIEKREKKKNKMLRKRKLKEYWELVEGVAVVAAS